MHVSRQCEKHKKRRKQRPAAVCAVPRCVFPLTCGAADWKPGPTVQSRSKVGRVGIYRQCSSRGKSYWQGIWKGRQFFALHIHILLDSGAASASCAARRASAAPTVEAGGIRGRCAGVGLAGAVVKKCRNLASYLPQRLDAIEALFKSVAGHIGRCG